MDPKSLDLDSDHVLNIIQEQEFNIPSNSGPTNASEPVAIDHDPLSMSQEYVICLEKELNDLNTATQDPETTDANANNSVESPTCERKACRSLLSGSKKEYMEICVRLYKAAITGDWEAAKVILERRPELVRFAITPIGDTTLNIATLAKATKQGEVFVENLVKMMEIEDLEIENEFGDVPYLSAAGRGNVHMFEVMMNKHKDLLSIFPEKTLDAVNLSAENGNHDMTMYLYNVLETASPSFWGDVERCLFFKYCIHGDLFDIALKVLEDHPIVGTSERICFTTLDTLARRPDTINRRETNAYKIWRIAHSILAFFHVKKNSPEMDNQALQLVKSLLKLYPIYSQHDILDGVSVYIDGKEALEKDINLFGLLFTAVEMRNTKFVIELLRMLPTAIYAIKDCGISIFHIAIKCRNKDIYNLLYETGIQHSELTKWYDDEHNNILYLLARTSKDTAQLQTVSGASLLMQRELLWYKVLTCVDFDCAYYFHYDFQAG